METYIHRGIFDLSPFNRPNGKGNVSRKIPFSAGARLYLTRYLTTRDDDEPALFISNFRKRISVRTVQHMLSQFGVHPHELRHTFAKELVSNGVDISTVADLCGHSDINVTRRYSKPTERDLEAAIDKRASFLFCLERGEPPYCKRCPHLAQRVRLV
jgi:integrase/recombinase XerD